MLSSFLLALAAAPLALGGVVQRSSNSSTSDLPACDADYIPCKCPSGTTFKNLTSYGVIGAPATDVTAIMGSFFNISFQGGLVPSSTEGTDGVAGAVRSFNFSGPTGYYQISEILVEYETLPDGGFIQRYEQSPVPQEVQIPGAGAYWGEWAFIEAQQTLVPNETAVAYKNWRCETGETFPAAQSHEGAIANTSDILTANGQATGVEIEPFTIVYEVRND